MKMLWLILSFIWKFFIYEALKMNAINASDLKKQGINAIAMALADT